MVANVVFERYPFWMNVCAYSSCVGSGDGKPTLRDGFSPPGTPRHPLVFGFLRFSSDFTVVSTGQCRCRRSRRSAPLEAARRYRANGARRECKPLVKRKRAPIPAAPGARGARLRFARRCYLVRGQADPARLWRARAGCGGRASQLRRAVSRARSRAHHGGGRLAA